MGALSMRCKEVWMQLKEVIIRLNKQNRPIRAIGETLGVAQINNLVHS